MNRSPPTTFLKGFLAPFSQEELSAIPLFLILPVTIPDPMDLTFIKRGQWPPFPCPLPLFPPSSFVP